MPDHSPIRLCVYCGSNTGTSPAFAATAARLGTSLANRGIGLVFGGGRVGLMGLAADAALQAAARKYDAAASYMTRAVAGPERLVAGGRK